MLQGRSQALSALMGIAIYTQPIMRDAMVYCHILAKHPDRWKACFYTHFKCSAIEMQFFGNRNKLNLTMTALGRKFTQPKQASSLKVRFSTERCANCGFATINLASSSCLTCGRVAFLECINVDNNNKRRDGRHTNLKFSSGVTDEFYYCNLCCKIFKNEIRFRDHVWPCRIKTFVE